MKSKAIFLDKDGTLVPDIPYNADPALVTISKNTVEGLRILSRAGYLLIVVTNQSGIARGFFAPESLNDVFRKIDHLLAEYQIAIDAFYYCPHHPEGSLAEFAKNCNCRKPMPGLIETAAKEWNVDLAHSWMIGDILNDVEAGNRAGCRTVLIDNGNETEWILSPTRKPTMMARSIDEAAALIVNEGSYEKQEQPLAKL